MSRRPWPQACDVSAVEFFVGDASCANRVDRWSQPMAFPFDVEKYTHSDWQKQTGIQFDFMRVVLFNGQTGTVRRRGT